MIGEFFLNIIFALVSGFLSLMPDFTWSVDTSAFEYFLTILKIAGYVFPWSTVIAIAGLIIGLSIFRIVIAFIKAIWDLLPLV